MDLKRLFKKEYVVGLDIGSSSIKMACFVNGPAGLLLVRSDLKEFKRSDDPALTDQEIVSTLKLLLMDIDVKRSRVIANINCPNTAIRKIVAPYIPRSELKDGIRLEAKNYFPFPVDESMLDFEILGDIVEKGVRKYEVIVAVSPRKTIDRYLSLLKLARIGPASFVCAPYALYRIASHLRKPGDGTRCLIDIGESFTELVIVKGGDLVFSRKLPISGGDFTRAMTGMLASDRGKTQLSLDEAEKIKIHTGIPSGGRGDDIVGDKISGSQVLSMLRMPMEQFIGEIERSFDYYREASGGGKIDSVILFGGGSGLGGLIKYLSESLSVDVSLGDPEHGLEMASRSARGMEKISYRLELAMACALAMDKGINLLPIEIKEKTKIVIKRGAVEAIATAVLLALLLINIGMRIQLVNFQKRISVAKMELSSLSDQLKEIDEQSLANKILIDEPQWEDVFKELSNVVPDTMRVTNLKLDNDVIVMRGIVASEEGDQILADFILTLERGIFDGVKLVESKRLVEAPGVEFELKCWVDYEHK